LYGYSSCAQKNRATFASCFDTVIGQADAFVAGVVGRCKLNPVDPKP
jgi:hypothetical protein